MLAHGASVAGDAHSSPLSLVGRCSSGAGAVHDCPVDVDSQPRRRVPRVTRRARLALQTAAVSALFVAATLYSWTAGPGVTSQTRTASGLRGVAVPATTHWQSSPFLPHGSPAARQLAADGNGTCKVTGGELSLVGLLSGQTCCQDRNESCCASFDMWLGVIVYFLVVLYTFLGLAIICDDYFCESLERISEALSLSDDVAGATFMAAGSSAPELFTAVVTTLIIEGSEGLGTIVGSAIFNIMIIVGVTAICAGQTLEIWWYPLTRDCVVYVISVVAMAAVVVDFEVHWYESLVLVLCYGGYIALMVYNGAITDWIESRSAKVEPTPAAAAALAGSSFSRLPASGTSSGKVTDTDVSKAAAALAAAAAAGGGGPLRNPFASHGSLPRVAVSSASEPKREAPVAPLSSFKSAGSAGSGFDATVSALSRPSSRHGQLAPLQQKEKEAADEAKATPGSGATSSPGPSSAPTASLLSSLAGAAKSKKRAAGAGGSGAGSGAATGTVPKSKQQKRGMNPMFKSVNRRSANPQTDAERRKARAQLQVGTLLKVHSAKSILLRRLRARQASRRALGGSSGGSPAAAAAASFGSSGSLMAKLAASSAKAEEAENKKKEEDEAKNDDDDDEGILDKILYVASLPYIGAFKVTVPDCREKRWEKWYMATFGMSIFWIGVLSFLMVDFAARAGCVLRIPGILMGLVVIAAGTSVPDALSSVLVAKNGQGDMAVANVLGSNVFNIFLGLGLPWFLKSAISDMSPIQLNRNENIVLPTIILLGYVVVFVGCIAGNKWRLTSKLGYVFIAAHALFVVWSLLTMLENPLIKV